MSDREEEEKDKQETAQSSCSSLNDVQIIDEFEDFTEDREVVSDFQIENGKTVHLHILHFFLLRSCQELK